jgi:hypothetical protein
MPEDRAEMQERRTHGLKARHETREARAVRKATAEEIATRLGAIADGYSETSDQQHALAIQAGGNSFDGRRYTSAAQAYGKKADATYAAARIAREIGSRDPQ